MATKGGQAVPNISYGTFFVNTEEGPSSREETDDIQVLDPKPEVVDVEGNAAANATASDEMKTKKSCAASKPALAWHRLEISIYGFFALFSIEILYSTLQFIVKLN
ncbi:hypothetical protein O0L34_g12683 [Tuta absoluta]|nr:hypothetical protein O0L34_g12683 [Tuta absoluta]